MVRNPKRNRATYYLSYTGYKKIWQAINEEFSDTIPNPQKVENYIKDKKLNFVSKDTIRKIVYQKCKTDLAKIQSLFIAFNVSLSENQDLTSQPPAQSESLTQTYSREKLCCEAAYHNLPIQDNRFIGRKEELRELIKCLSDDYPQPIIQVDGIGGVGKTALVLEAAYLCLEKREDCLSPGFERNYDVPYFGSIIWTSAKETELLSIGISPIMPVQRTLQEIYRTIANTLEDPALLHGKDDGRHLEKIINRLKKSSSKNLLIIDNLETLENKRKVISFIKRLHNTKIVVTTREQAGIYSNICLDSLSKDESLELLQQQQKKAKLELTNKQQEELCELSTGIPLVIIYSMGRLANQKPLSLELFDLVKFDLRNADGDIAHFCFQKLVDDIKDSLSYKLLIAAAIFDESFSSEALVEVAGLSAEPRHLVYRELEKLQRISLIRHNHARYSMLPITREYAISQLNKNPVFQELAQKRWINYYINYAKNLYESQSKNERFKNFYATLDDEWKNFLGVLRFCKDCNDYEKVKHLWSYLNNYSNLRGHWQDRLDWLTWLINTSRNKKEYAKTVSFMARKGRILLLMGKKEDLIDAKKLFLEAWELREYAKFSDLDYLTNHLAGLFSRLEQYEQAHKWLDEEQKNLDKQTQISPEERSLYQLYIDRERAELLFYQGDYQDSKELCEKVVLNSRAIKHDRNENYAKKIIADIAIIEGELEKAERILRLGIQEVKSCDDKRRIAYYQVSLALLEKEKGNLPQAKDWISQAMNHFKPLGMIRDFQNAKEIQNRLKQST